MSPDAELGETGSCHTELAVWKEGGKGGGMFQEALPCKTTLTVRKSCQHVSVQEHMESWFMHISFKTSANSHGNTRPLFIVNSIKLHLAALKYQY